MKKNIPFLLLIFFNNVLIAQITTPVIKANFGVDADLRANYFNGAVNSAVDDWYNNGTAGSGQFMIDTTGAAAIVAGYTSNPASRMYQFSRLMDPMPYTTVSNRLVLDAVFHRDFHGTDSTVFAAGSNKNGMSPALWSCPVAQNIPDKNDILDVFAHVRRAGPNVTDSLWMFGGISIVNTTGNRYFDFELYQTDIYYDRPTRTFKNYGPDAGHTSWTFDASGNVLTAGDIIFSAEFGGSSITGIEARIWVHQSSLAITPVNFNWGGSFDGDGAGAVYGYASIVPKTAGAFYSGIQSVNNTWAGPFSLVLQDNSVVTNYVANQFMEISVNLTKLGIDPGTFSNNPCGTPFRRVLIKSRSSSSFTAELKDFVWPFSMFNYPPVDAYTEFLYFCEVFPPTTIYVQNPNPTSIYTWSTTNGHIVGSNIGTSIVVDAPGTYTVTQQLHVQCLAYSYDSVIILFDSVCQILDINLLNFSARRLTNDIELKWQASNNQEAVSYEIEYSFDNRHFIQLASIPPSNVNGLADYSFKYPVPGSAAPIIYYRIKVTAKNGRSKYSEIVLLKLLNNSGKGAIIFPNPTHGDLWLSVKKTTKETAEVTVWSTQGKLIYTNKVEINSGENLLKLPDLSDDPPGIYILKIKMADETITNKILKLN